MGNLVIATIRFSTVFEPDENCSLYSGQDGHNFYSHPCDTARAYMRLVRLHVPLPLDKGSRLRGRSAADLALEVMARLWGYGAELSGQRWSYLARIYMVI